MSQRGCVAKERKAFKGFWDSKVAKKPVEYGVFSIDGDMEPCEILGDHNENSVLIRYIIPSQVDENDTRVIEKSDLLRDDLLVTKNKLLEFREFPEKLDAFKVFYDFSQIEFSETEMILFLEGITENIGYYWYADNRLEALEGWFDYLMDKGFDVLINNYIEELLRKDEVCKKNRAASIRLRKQRRYRALKNVGETIL